MMAHYNQRQGVPGMGREAEVLKFNASQTYAPQGNLMGPIYEGLALFKKWRNLRRSVTTGRRLSVRTWGIPCLPPAISPSAFCNPSLHDGRHIH